MSASGLIISQQSLVIPPQGVYFDMPEEEYRSIPALSYSSMKSLEISALQFWHQEISPTRPPKRETDFFDFGHALHCAVLEPRKFEQFFCREFCYDYQTLGEPLTKVDEMRDWIRSQGETPSGRKKDDVIEHVLSFPNHPPVLDALIKEYNRENDGKTILDCETWDRVIRAAEALRSEPKLMSILEEGHAEVSLFWIDPETGVPCKGRIDWLTTFVTLDLKTFTQKIPQSIDYCIAQEIFKRKYYRQAYMYTTARTMLGLGNKPFIIAFVESDEPHEIRLKRLEPGKPTNLYWELGRNETRHFIRTFAEYWKRFGVKPWRDMQEISPLVDKEIPQLAWK